MMENNDFRKLVTGLSLVALLGGAGLTLSGCAATSGGPETKAETAGKSTAVKAESSEDVLSEDNTSLTG